MASFSEFLGSIYRDGNDGKQFEQFAKWFLTHDPVWKIRVAEIWLWDEFPERWGKDKGIDLVFKDRNGEYWAVQAKCYSADYYVTKADIDSFLSESNRKIISRRLLMATTDKLGSNAAEVCKGQEKPVTRLMLSSFEHAEIDYPDDYKKLHKVTKKPRPTARDHQKIAIKDVVKGFKKADRGQLIMACGTGKTFTTLWIKEKIKSRNTLVLLPSLNLLAQTVREWSFASKSELSILCVCSDKSVGRKKDDDEAVQSVSDVPFPVQSDVSEIRKFMRGDGDKVIFSTYQSSDLVAEAQQDDIISPFSLVVADEAHRCAINGKSDSPFSTVLDGKRIKADKRLFATATPRTYTTRVKKAAEERGVDVIGMDDEAVFGKPFHTLTFAEAIKNDPPLLTDYQVAIVGVDNAMVSQWIEDRELVTPETGDAVTDAGSLAAQIGLLKAMKDYNLKRVISFHSRVKRAEEFSKDIHDAIGIIKKRNRPKGKLKADFVSGKMSTSDRGDKLKSLKSIGDNEIGLLSNARCLSEGVDVPSLDGVAFVDPKNSQVDIIQAVGRAIRLSKEKDIGTIVLPVFIADGESPEERIEASNFKPVWWVLDALKSHDDVLVDELDGIRTEMGRRGVASAGKAALSKIEIDMPVSVGGEFAGALKTRLVEQTTASWVFWFGLLEEYSNEYGTSQVLSDHITVGGFRLGNWVVKQRERYQKSNLLPDRTKKLIELPNWTWDTRQELFEIGLAHLNDYVQRHGNSDVPDRCEGKDGFKLGPWVRTRRQDYKKGLLDEKFIARLEEVTGWFWSGEQSRFKIGLGYLQEYFDEVGHPNVPDNYSAPDGFKLANWRKVLVRKHKNGSLDQIYVDLLEAFRGWKWKPGDSIYQDGLDCLLEFVRLKGHSRVPTGYVTANNFKLGNWVGNRRQSYKRNELSENRVLQLEALPSWTWNPRDYDFLVGIKHLKGFVTEFGHSRVPISHVTTDHYKLGFWVSNRRADHRKGTLTPDKVAELTQFPEWYWDQ
jgi:superfamily II DNA or RNA helicase